MPSATIGQPVGQIQASWAARQRRKAGRGTRARLARTIGPLSSSQLPRGRIRVMRGSIGDRDHRLSRAGGDCLELGLQPLDLLRQHGSRLGIGDRHGGSASERRRLSLQRRQFLLQDFPAPTINTREHFHFRRSRGGQAIGANFEMLLFVDVGEEGRHRIEILRRVRIVLVVVALSTPQRGSHPDRRQIPHAIGRVDRQILLGLHAAFVRRLQQAVVARSDASDRASRPAASRRPTVRDVNWSNGRLSLKASIT